MGRKWGGSDARHAADRWSGLCLYCTDTGCKEVLSWIFVETLTRWDSWGDRDKNGDLQSGGGGERRLCEGGCLLVI